MPRFVAVYTMAAHSLAAFRARPESEQKATDNAVFESLGRAWSKRNAAAIVARVRMNENIHSFFTFTLNFTIDAGIKLTQNESRK